jgi:hypothetical protein
MRTARSRSVSRWCEAHERAGIQAVEHDLTERLVLVPKHETVYATSSLSAAPHAQGADDDLPALLILKQTNQRQDDARRTHQS